MKLPNRKIEQETPSVDKLAWGEGGGGGGAPRSSPAEAGKKERLPVSWLGGSSPGVPSFICCFLFFVDKCAECVPALLQEDTGTAVRGHKSMGGSGSGAGEPSVGLEKPDSQETRLSG